MKKQIFKVKNTQVNLADLKAMLKQQSEVSAAYLFGSAAKGESVVNDLDIMVLLHRHVDKHQVYFNLTHKLSQVTNISEDLIDLLFFDLEEANLTVLTRAVKQQLERIALVIKESIFSSIYADAIKKKLLNSPIQLQIFDNISQAKSWLSSE